MTETNIVDDTIGRPSWLRWTFEPSVGETIAEGIDCERKINEAMRLKPDHITFWDAVRVKYWDNLGNVVAAVQSWHASDDDCEYDTHEQGEVSFWQDMLRWSVRKEMDCFKMDCVSDFDDPENVYRWTELHITLDMSRYPEKAG